MSIRIITLTLVVSATWGCSLVGPSCLGRQQRGTVTKITATLAPGEMAVHRIPYETSGSQNDVTFSWNGDRQPDGPRLRLYATRAACEQLQLPAEANAGPCAILGSAGANGDALATILFVTHGRGNPEVLGTPPAFALWVVGDAHKSATYSIAVTWFYGPDC